MWKYVIAAVLGFFSSPVICAARGIYIYDFGFSDIALAGLYALIVWCWCGRSGVYQQIKDYFLSRNNKNVHR